MHFLALSIPFIALGPPDPAFVLQTNVFPKVSCGSGCHFKVEQLTPMVDLGDGWRKVKIKSTTYIYNLAAQKLEQRSRDPLHNGISTKWNYSNCKTKIFTQRSKEYFAAPPAPEARYERNQNAFLSDGKPNFYSVNGSVFQRWRAMCPETAAAKKGTEEVRAWWDNVINMLKNRQERIKNENQ